MFKFLQKNRPSATDSFFLAILLLEDSVQAVLWTVIAGQIKIVEKSIAYTYANENDCLVKTDLALQELGSQSEGVDESIFIFEPEWVDGGDISKFKKPLLKKLTNDLAIRPLGFVILTEALSEYFLKNHACESLLMAYLSSSSLNLFLLEHGKLLAEARFGQSGEINNDLVEGLAQLRQKLKDETKLFPNKLYLSSLNLPADQLEALQQQLIAYHWPEGFFIQTPLIELFSADQLFNVAVTEAGRVVAEQKQIPVLGEKSSLQTKMGARQLADQITQFGFDNLQPGTTMPTANSPIGTSAIDAPIDGHTNPTQMSTFGVPVADAVANKYIVSQNYDNLSLPNTNNFNPANQPLGVNFDQKIPQNRLAALLTNKLQMMLLSGVATGLLLVVLFFYIWLSSFSKIIIRVTPTSKIIAKQVEITLDPSATASNPQKLVLKANLLTEEYTQKTLAPTTGTKTIGEKAKGRVTIFNKTTDIKVFDKGTILKSGSLQFALDEEVKVASASVKANESGDGETKDYGKAEVAITAIQVGEESNLAKASKLAIADYSDGTYSAEVNSELTGGLSKEAQVVSAKDMENLLAETKTELKKQAEQDFAKKSGNGTYYLVTSSLSKEQTSFDAKVDEEADVLNLTFTANVTVIQYFGDDLKPLASYVLATEVPAGYQLVDKDPEILSAPKTASASAKSLQLEVNVQSKAVAQIDTKQLQDQILGLPLTDLGSINQDGKIKKLETFFDPQPASWLVKRLPKNDNRLQIVVD